MGRQPEGPLRTARQLLRPIHIPALFATAAVIFFGLLADRQDRELAAERVRANVQHHLTVIRERLEGNLNADIVMGRGLAGVVATEPEIDQARFAEIAAPMVAGRPEVRLVAGAPGLIVSLAHPLEGNEAAIGLDYRENQAQRDAALRTRETEQPVLAGPLDLVQGGRGFVLRLPVFEETSGRQTFWGTISIVIDLESFYRNSGLLEPDLPIELAIVGRDALGEAGGQFYGDPAILEREPITATVNLPHGSWHLSAIPRGGWAAATNTNPYLWVLTFAVALLVAVPVLAAGRLFEERRRHLAELKLREVKLERLSRRLELALDTSELGVWELDLDTGELFWDDRMNELYGYPQDGGKRRYEHWSRRLADPARAKSEAEFEAAIVQDARYESEYELDVDGTRRVIRALGTCYRAADGSRKILGVNWDVTDEVDRSNDLKRAKALTDARNVELEEARSRIEHNSLHDFLTGLPNRMFLDRVLEEHATRCASGGGGIVLLHLDLDRFKEINDTLGHHAGDVMLVQAARRIRQTLEPGSFVARTGGDEFVIICEAADGRGGAETLARRLIEEMQKPVTFEGKECRFGLSVGIAGATGTDVDRKKLLVNADIALYRAKNRGRNRYEIFDASLQARIISRKRTADGILEGLEKGHFVPYFQPQFDAKSFEVVGVEALARWQHPESGILMPDVFVGVAEEIGALPRIDAVILERSLEAFRDWRRQGLRIPRLSVNVSSRRLHDEALLDEVRRLDFERGTLAFELVESVYLDQSDAVVRSNIRALAETGIEIEIDDFGTGYASIVSLMNLRPHRLKIDRQIIRPVAASTAQADLVRSILEIGRALGIRVVAEGVETNGQAALLRDMGCDVLQGFALARPMSAADVARFLTTRRAQVA